MQQEITAPAGLGRRLVANLLDTIIIGVPLTVISYIIFGNLEGDIYTNLVSFLYALILPIVWTGFTIGKKIMGVQIVKVNGAKLGIGAMILRVIGASILYAVTLGIGLLVSLFMVLFRKDKRAIHDLIAGTYVKRV